MPFNFAEKQFEIVLEEIQKDAIEFRLRHTLEMPYNIFGTLQMNLG